MEDKLQFTHASLDGTHIYIFEISQLEEELLCRRLSIIVLEYDINLQSFKALSDSKAL